MQSDNPKMDESGNSFLKRGDTSKNIMLRCAACSFLLHPSWHHHPLTKCCPFHAQLRCFGMKFTRCSMNIYNPFTSILKSYSIPIPIPIPIPMGSLHETKVPEFEFLRKKPYVPPSWAAHLNPAPSHVFALGHFPTPIHKWNLPNLPKNTEVYVKRDDLSGMQLSGNKVRKLEFLMAEATAEGADCIITIGGVQSNHCRATAVAANYLNLDCYLILRTSKDLVNKDPGLAGNLLVERLAGAHVELVSEQDYARVGRVELTNILKEKLLSEGRKPYVIPMGGSTSLATWGYIEAVREIQQQLKIGNNFGATFDDIVVACGSGCTGAGLALGSRLSGLGAEVHAYSSWGEPDYFYEYAQGLLDGLQAGLSSYDILDIKDAKGIGYAINTEEELIFVKEIAEKTGIILDPVYSGKAAYRMTRDMADDPAAWEGRKVLFIHTGGLLSLFHKADDIAPLIGNWRKMDIHG